MTRKRCEHGKQKYYCKECGSGKAFCKHGLFKHKCRECKGNSYCCHGKQKRLCGECGGQSLCKQKDVSNPRVKYCCPHGRQCKSRCPECLHHSVSLGKCSSCNCVFEPDQRFMFNGKPLQTCEKCRYKCPHGKHNNKSCIECTKLSKYCEHKKDKYRCNICNPVGHMRHVVECAVWRALHSKKSLHTIEYLGCTIAEFKKHIEKQFMPGMTWENHGKIWHIDHIIPVKYNKPTLEQVIQRLHYRNTQPLLGGDNLEKVIT